MLRIYKLLIKNSKFALNWLLKRRLQKGKESPARLDERRGLTDLPRPAGSLVWLHAASVGEAQSALSLINQILKTHTHTHFLVTTGTLTSAVLMEKNLPERAIHQFYPLDHPQWVARFLDHWRPDLALWIESELWPNMLAEIKKRGIKTFLVNARMSERSFGRWKRFNRAAIELLSTFSGILAQTDTDSQRFRILGGQNVQVTDNLKYSAKALPVNEDDLQALQAQMQGRLCWVYASSHKGEEEMACRIHQILATSLPDLLTIIVPRHPERGEDIVKACEAHGLHIMLRSDGQEKTAPTLDTNIYIANTLGELGLFYRLAPVACIGRSFSDDGGGGHNPIEAAQLNCAVLHGPNVQYQTDIYEEMNAEGAALKMSSEAEMLQTLHELLSDPKKMQAQQARGTNFAQYKEGVLERVMDVLEPHLGIPDGDA